VGEIVIYGYMQAGPQDCYGAFYKNYAFAREHTMSITALVHHRWCPRRWRWDLAGFPFM